MGVFPEPTVTQPGELASDTETLTKSSESCANRAPISITASGNFSLHKKAHGNISHSLSCVFTGFKQTGLGTGGGRGGPGFKEGEIIQTVLSLTTPFLGLSAWAGTSRDFTSIPPG